VDIEPVDKPTLVMIGDALQGLGPAQGRADGGTVSVSLKNAGDDDKNFFVLAATGSYKITVNLNEPRSVDLEP
jgi:hypothetical protein